MKKEFFLEEPFFPLFPLSDFFPPCSVERLNFFAFGLRELIFLSKSSSLFSGLGICRISTLFWTFSTDRGNRLGLTNIVFFGGWQIGPFQGRTESPWLITLFSSPLVCFLAGSRQQSDWKGFGGSGVPLRSLPKIVLVPLFFLFRCKALFRFDHFFFPGEKGRKCF